MVLVPRKVDEMIALSRCLGFLAVLHLVVSSTQNPPLTPCSGDNFVVEFESITVKDAKLGKEVQIDATVSVNTTVGQNPVLQLSVSKPDGTTLPCVEDVLPCNLNLCDGKIRLEKRLNKDWNNSCPVQPGTYTAELEFRLPKNEEAKEYFGDGNVEITTKIVDGDQVLGCLQYPVKVDVD
ncbi:uncharacterized protein LOC142564510 [Dermacentor variabilis]|uniref:uncharacterized protein LOC142564510 n=1 Tax=Dermacentor variabilis TaxID=34621 RepID=UPI003F5C99AC